MLPICADVGLWTCDRCGRRVADQFQMYSSRIKTWVIKILWPAQGCAAAKQMKGRHQVPENQVLGLLGATGLLHCELSTCGMPRTLCKRAHPVNSDSSVSTSSVCLNASKHWLTHCSGLQGPFCSRCGSLVLCLQLSSNHQRDSIILQWCCVIQTELGTWRHERRKEESFFFRSLFPSWSMPSRRQRVNQQRLQLGSLLASDYGDNHYRAIYI